ncbi:MAG: Asp-tRNA(Asn)/Glu-tRNA(Gln) amidotransferase subunit GatC [Christensenella sp.]
MIKKDGKSMRVTLEEVDKIASLSMLSLDDEKKKMLQKNLDDILEHAEKLNELDTEGVEPTSYILKQHNVVREDIAGKVWDRADMLKNASETEDGCFVVPKVVD